MFNIFSSMIKVAPDLLLDIYILFNSVDLGGSMDSKFEFNITQLDPAPQPNEFTVEFSYGYNFTRLEIYVSCDSSK